MNNSYRLLANGILRGVSGSYNVIWNGALCGHNHNERDLAIRCLINSEKAQHQTDKRLAELYGMQYGRFGGK